MSDVALTMTASEARELTDQAIRSVEQASDLAQEAVQLVEHVISLGGHRELGYSTPAEYLHSEFNVSGLPVTPDKRREMALMLVRNGVSKRGAARALGVDDKTVRKDLSNADQSALPDRLESSDGRSIPSSRPAAVTDDGVVDAELVDERQHTPTTGGLSDADLLDGRGWVQPAGPEFEGMVTRPAPAPTPEQPKPKRRPLPEAFLEAARNLTKAAETLGRLTEDDRFTRNRDQTHHQMPELLGALENAARLMQAMNLPTAEASEEARRWWATSLNKTSNALTGVANSINKEN